MTVVTVLSGTVGFFSRLAAGDAISDAKAKAAQIEAQLTQTQNQMSLLSQQYDAAKERLSQVNENMSLTRANIATDQRKVNDDKATLAKGAVANYVTDGTAVSDNSIFSGDQRTAGATNEYSEIAEGDLSREADNLQNAENALDAQEAQLQDEQSQAQAQLGAEQSAVAQNDEEEQQQQNALNQEQGQIAQLVQQQQEAEAAAAVRAAQAKIAAAAAAQAAAAQAAGAQARIAAAAQSAQTHADPQPSTTATTGDAPPSGTTSPAAVTPAAPPPTSTGGAGAVLAAESQLGVPYVWGAESPKGSADPGFDCSGLTAWAWGQVGVSLPHYSGAQMADSTPVPLSDLQPGDLLFYGPGGSAHVAMYVGPGTMIEAPYTGASVWLTSLRLGDGFVGAGRP